jgi:hypothetical protein
MAPPHFWNRSPAAAQSAASTRSWHCCTSSTGLQLAGRSALRASLRASTAAGIAVVACMATPPAADAASGKQRRPQCVQQVRSHGNNAKVKTCATQEAPAKVHVCSCSVSGSHCGQCYLSWLVMAALSKPVRAVSVTTRVLSATQCTEHVTLAPGLRATQHIVNIRHQINTVVHT